MPAYDSAYANLQDAYAFLYMAEKDMAALPRDSLSGLTRSGLTTTRAIDSPACGKLVG